MTFKRNVITAAASLMFVGSIFATGADAATRAEVKRMVVEEARDSTVPTALALAVATVESNFDERALSSAGARGVMQIMPATARDVFGIAAEELWDARLNVQLGIDYLEQLQEQYGGRWDLALSHYNGGTLKGGSGASARPHSYTKKYVADVMKWSARYAEQARIWQVAGDPTDMNNLSGWSQKPGKAVNVITDDWRSDEASKARSRVTRIVVRRIPNHEGAERVGGVYRNDTDGSELEKRLRRARRTLDDFSSGSAFVRWYEG
jgi:hypothetical protein